MKQAALKCAIYTRKSTEEGLDQEFNSLDAQAESCAAFIASQKGSGWVQAPAEYNDGGYSGGNMERPALKRLMADIALGLINIVVVYKIDRLTRSLMDFSKLVEVFDRYGVTFVSVTQSFNTTTSMGRLTLNVLLSFAQFEREVIGERVRDKIAASKQKGMWMGGATPVGYRCEDKKLIPDEQGRVMVEHIFNRYVELGSVSKLKNELDRLEYRSPVRNSKRGLTYGGYKFSRGILYKILKNPLYIGQVVHKDKVYDGQHEPLISLDLWAIVQRKLGDQAPNISENSQRGGEVNLLKGKVFDLDGNLYSPSYTVKDDKRYRYYVSQAVLQYKAKPHGVITRLPAGELEELIISTLNDKVRSGLFLINFGLLETDWEYQQIISEGKTLILHGLIKAILNKVIVRPNFIMLEIDMGALAREFENAYKMAINPQSEIFQIEVPFITGRAKSWALILEAESGIEKKKDVFDLPSDELQRWVQGVIWRDEHFRGMPIERIAARENVSSSHIHKYIDASLAG